MTAPVVRRLYADYLAGSSLRALGAALDRDGILTPTGGNRWGPTSVRNILLNPAYPRGPRLRWQYERKLGGGYSRRERAGRIGDPPAHGHPRAD